MPCARLEREMGCFVGFLVKNVKILPRSVCQTRRHLKKQTQMQNHLQASTYPKCFETAVFANQADTVPANFHRVRIRYIPLGITILAD